MMPYVRTIDAKVKFIRERLLVKTAAKPPMPGEAREFLCQYYRDDVGRLEEALGRRLAWRKFSAQRADRLVVDARTSTRHAYPRRTG